MSLIWYVGLTFFFSIASVLSGIWNKHLRLQDDRLYQ